MNKHLQYLGYVIRHKWYTFLAARELGITWLGIIHDWTKFLPSEWFAYVNQFYGNEKPMIVSRNATGTFDSDEVVAMRSWEVGQHVKCYGLRWVVTVKKDAHFALTDPHPREAFDRAWLHHQKSNKHHWQWYLLQYDQGEAWGIQSASAGKAHCTIENYLETGRELQVFGDPDFIGHAVATLNLSPVALPMPDKYRKEMLADWRGAGKAITGKDNTDEWYKSQRHNIILHPETREWVERELGKT